MEKQSIEIISYFSYNFPVSSLFILSPDNDRNMYRVLLTSRRVGVLGSCSSLHPSPGRRASPEFLPSCTASTSWTSREAFHSRW